MNRPGYREAMEWLAGNDDCYWVGEENKIMSVAACMVRDLYGVSEEKLLADLRRWMKRIYPDHEALR